MVEEQEMAGHAVCHGGTVWWEEQEAGAAHNPLLTSFFVSLRPQPMEQYCLSRGLERVGVGEGVVSYFI